MLSWQLIIRMTAHRIILSGQLRRVDLVPRRKGLFNSLEGLPPITPEKIYQISRESRRKNLLLRDRYAGAIHLKWRW